MGRVFQSVVWILVIILLFFNNAGVMAENGTSYSFDVVYTDKIDNTLTAKNLSRGACIYACYWSPLCATMIYDTTEGECYHSNDLYTVFTSPPRLSTKVGSSVYQWGSDDCPRQSWSFHKPTGYCLKYHGAQIRTFAAAMRTCENEGSRLVNVMDAAQNDVIDFVGRYSGKNQIWLGGDVASNTWHLGGEITFTDWSTSAPTTGCIALLTQVGKWTELSCSFGRMFICEKITFNPCKE